MFIDMIPICSVSKVCQVTSVCILLYTRRYHIDLLVILWLGLHAQWHGGVAEAEIRQWGSTFEQISGCKSYLNCKLHDCHYHSVYMFMFMLFRVTVSEKKELTEVLQKLSDELNQLRHRSVPPTHIKITNRWLNYPIKLIWSTPVLVATFCRINAMYRWS